MAAISAPVTAPVSVPAISVRAPSSPAALTPAETLVTTTSENLFTERRTSAATFGGISNKMFFVLRLLPF